MNDLKITTGNFTLCISRDYAMKIMHTDDPITSTEREKNGIFFGTEGHPRFGLARSSKAAEFFFISNSTMNMMTEDAIKLTAEAVKYLKNEAAKSQQFNDLIIDWTNGMVEHTKRKAKVGQVYMSGTGWNFNLRPSFAENHVLTSSDLNALVSIIANAPTKFTR